MTNHCAALPSPPSSSSSSCFGSHKSCFLSYSYREVLKHTRCSPPLHRSSLHPLARFLLPRQLACSHHFLLSSSAPPISLPFLSDEEKRASEREKEREREREREIVAKQVTVGERGLRNFAPGLYA